MKFSKIISKCVKHIYNNLNVCYNYFKNMYIYCFKRSVFLFEYLILQWFGEEMLDLLWDHWNRVIFFYTSLWYIIKKRVYDKFDTVLLIVIWKIKRSDNIFLKWVGKQLTKYPWFNDNIIKF